MDNLTQAMVPLLANITCVVPYINPKHQGERQIKSEKDQIKAKTNILRIKRSIKGQNNSDLDRSRSFKPKLTKSESRSD